MYSPKQLTGSQTNMREKAVITRHDWHYAGRLYNGVQYLHLCVIATVVVCSINRAGRQRHVHLDGSLLGEESDRKTVDNIMFKPSVIIHMMLAAISTVTVAASSPPVFNQVRVNPAHAITLSAIASCHMPFCDDDFIQPYTKGQRVITETPLLKHSSPTIEADARRKNAFKAHDSDNLKMGFNPLDLPINSKSHPAVNVARSNDEAKQEELMQTTDASSAGLRSIHLRKTRSIRNVADVFRRAFKNIGKILM